MNTAYEIEYNALKMAIERIGTSVDRLIGMVNNSLERGIKINCEDLKRTEEEIRETMQKLESEVMRFLVEYKPKDSDLRSVLVLIRLSNRFSEIASYFAAMIKEMKDPEHFNTSYLGATGMIRDILKDLNYAIAEEDFDLKNLETKTSQLDDRLNRCYHECTCLAEEPENLSALALKRLRCVTILEQTGRILKDLVSDLAYMINGTYELPGSAYTIVALE